MTIMKLICSKDLKNTPKLNSQDGVSDPMVFVHLHGLSGDWWLTELSDDGQLGFGYVRLSAMPDCAELGYISIDELQQVTDVYQQTGDLRYQITSDQKWQPTPLSEVKAQLVKNY